MTGTSAPPAEIQSLIEAHIKGFNTQNHDLFFSVFGDTAIIIDGITPYCWLNPTRQPTGSRTWRNGATVLASPLKPFRTRLASGMSRARPHTPSFQERSR